MIVHAERIWAMGGSKHWHASGGLRRQPPPVAPFLLSSLGGTAVFLFSLTDAPAAQPRAVLGRI